MENQEDSASEEFKFRNLTPGQDGASTVLNAEEERESKNRLTSDYLIDAIPSLGPSKTRRTNDSRRDKRVRQPSPPLYLTLNVNRGDIVLLHQGTAQYQPSAYLLSSSSGHKDVIRAIHHDISNEAIYTGSEDGVLCGWSIAGMRLMIGDPEVDDDGGDGREDAESVEEESEIETEESDDMDVDLEDEEEGPRHGLVLGRGDERKDKRGKAGRHQPY